MSSKILDFSPGQLALTVLGGVGAILAPGLAAHTRSTDVTWTKYVAPIVARKCVNCHAPGGSGQPVLATYRAVRARARAVRTEILQGRMPPWPAARGIGD